MQHLQALPAFIVGLALLTLASFFYKLFWRPARAQQAKLARAIAAIKNVDGDSHGAIQAVMEADKTLKHLWGEYNDTLHEQRELSAQTLQFEVVARRATVPAEAIFTAQVLVDTPVRTEFFKHLPGILTGLGIIGTFGGLIIGLQGFEVSSDPELVRKGLKTLVDGVHEAFFVSAAAITLAMLATAIEKIFLTKLYGQVEELCQLLDGQHQAGAGEEYLSRLVLASEASAKEAKQLKQALVEDLKTILEEISLRQIAASNASTASVADRIVAGMQEGLKEPLEGIRTAVQQVSGDQGAAVHKLLADTMAAMTAQIRDLFGSQITGINELQQQTMQAMTQAVGTLQQVAADMSRTGASTTESMATKMAEAMSAMETRQQVMNEQMRGLLDEVKTSMASIQGASNDKLQEALGQIAISVTDATTKLQALVTDAATTQVTTTGTLQSTTNDAVNQMANQVQALVAQTQTVSQQMGQTVAAMERLTTESATRLSTSAERLFAASEQFATAGSQTSSVLERSQALVQQLSGASTALTGSTTTLNAAINDYKAARDSLATMVEALRETVASAKSEAALTATVLQRIEDSTKALAQAEQKADEYLKGVTEVLAEAHNQFSTQVISTLSEVNGQFHEHLNSATRALAGAIEDLENAFDRIPG